MYNSQCLTVVTSEDKVAAGSPSEASEVLIMFCFLT